MMAQNAKTRHSVIHSLLPERSNFLLDIGCGWVTPSYPYADKAAEITCIDWKIQQVNPIPSNIKCLEADFTKIDLPSNYYDAIIASDVFEHVLLEQESLFVQKCLSSLKEGGHLIISVPHKGTFAWLDPYHVKPTIHNFLWHLGLYKTLHNGSCDIRKRHKHYATQEIAEKFKPLQLSTIRYWGYLFDPLLSWASALSTNSIKFPGYKMLEDACLWEFKQDYEMRSFNVALKFYKSSNDL